MGWPQKPASPRVDPRGANHGIEGRLERRFSLTSVARRWHGLERVAHRRRVCQHERVHLWGVNSRAVGGKGRHGRRLRARPSRRVWRPRIHRKGLRVLMRAQQDRTEWGGSNWTGS
jgi:hypothetical protein